MPGKGIRAKIAAALDEAFGSGHSRRSQEFEADGGPAGQFRRLKQRLTPSDKLQAKSDTAMAMKDRKYGRSASGNPEYMNLPPQDEQRLERLEGETRSIPGLVASVRSAFRPTPNTHADDEVGAFQSSVEKRSAKIHKGRSR